jgi:hypothetical protein
LHRLPSRCRINVDPAAIDGNGAFASGKFSQHCEERWKKVFSRNQYDMILSHGLLGGSRSNPKGHQPAGGWPYPAASLAFPISRTQRFAAR